MIGENGIDARLEGKLGFDKVRAMVSDRCSTEYAVARVAGETFVSDPKTIYHRLALTDEMRLIMMFEESFPTNGYIDCLYFLFRCGFCWNKTFLKLNLITFWVFSKLVLFFKYFLHKISISIIINKN